MNLIQNNNIKTLFIEIGLILLLTISLIKILPYQYGVEDQAIYLPLIKKSLNQSLYQNDYLLQSHSETTIFFKIIKVIYPFFDDLEKTFFLLYFLSIFFIFLGIYKLGQSLFHSRFVSLISVLIFMFPKWVGGTGVLTYENYFLPRLLATPFLLFSFYFLIHKKMKTSSLFSSISFIIHPVSATPLIVIFLLYLFFKRNLIKKKDFIFSFLIVFISLLIIVSLAQKEFVQTTKYLIMPDNWFNLVKKRDPFIFPQLWKLRSFGSLILFYFFYFLFLIQIRILKAGKNYLDKDKEIIINFAALISLSIPLLFIFLTKIIPITFILQLEPARSLVIFAYLSIVCFAYASYQIIRSKNPFLLKFFVFIFLFFSIFLWNNKHPEKVDKEFIDIQKWAKNNSGINTIFLTPPFKKGFRIYSERAIVGEYKDGGPLLFSYDLAKQWNERMEILKNFDYFIEEDFKKVKERYHYEYLVVGNEKQLNFKKIFSNSKYSIYCLP